MLSRRSIALFRQRPAAAAVHQGATASAEVARDFSRASSVPVSVKPARQARRLFGRAVDRGRTDCACISAASAEKMGVELFSRSSYFAALRQGPSPTVKQDEEARP